MKIRPLSDRILVERLEAEMKTAGGIVLPESAKEKPQRGKVICTGDGKLLDDGSRSKLQVKKGDDKGKWQVDVHGFDYYNTKKGQIESGDTSRIAVWMLDTDYDGRSLYPRQVFFPMASGDEGWAKLARNLKAEVDSEKIEAYRGTVSLPFEPGEHKRVAVKIVDDRGIESLKILEID